MTDLDPQLAACTWAMQSLMNPRTFIAVDAATAAAALACGIEVKLTTYAELLGYSPPAGEVG